MFMVTILLVHTAPTKQKLENIIYSVNGIANANNCDLIRLEAIVTDSGLPEETRQQYEAAGVKVLTPGTENDETTD